MVILEDISLIFYRATGLRFPLLCCTIQITPVYVPQRKMVYAAYISLVVTPLNVRGGARIDENARTSIVEPGGVLVVAMHSQDIVVRENDTVSVT